jgi:hypothetical protein
MPSLIEQSKSPSATTHRRPSVLILTSSLLTDRMLLYSGCLQQLSEDCRVRVWAASARNAEFVASWKESAAEVEEFPQVGSFREFPFNMARRLNEFAWDYRLQPPSRLSMRRHVRSKNESLKVRWLAAPGRLAAVTGLHEVLENQVERLLLSYSRSSDARARLQVDRPDCVITMNPFWFEEPGVVAEARRLGIPVFAMIPSWDNVTTKARMVFKYDGYLVWSKQMRDELQEYYPDSRNHPIHVVGAPQFDVFFQDRFHESRETFCTRHGLRTNAPIIVYAIGSPHFIKGEHFGALHLAERICAGDLGDVQMLVRPHPTKDNAELVRQFERFAPRVVVQSVAKPGSHITARSQTESQVRDWVSTFRNAAVVVNLSSTVTIDAAICDKPVVNLDYDPEPGQPNQALIKDVNHLWPHFKTVAESGGVWLVNDGSEMVVGVKNYLTKPSLHRENRRKMAEHVCGFIDGFCGQRLTKCINDLLKKLEIHAR